MSTQAQTPAQAAPSSSTLASVPRAMWVGFGTLALVSAGLAGALVMRTVGGTPQADAATPATAASLQATPAAPNATQPAQPQALAQAPQAPALPAPHAPAPRAVQPVHSAAVQPRPAPVQQGQAAPEGSWHAPVETRQAAVCATCGTVESVHAVQLQGQGTGLGVVAGGVIGGLLGHQVGGGSGKKAMTVLGAVGGGFAGNEVEKRARAQTEYDVTVRMEDGRLRTIRSAQSVAVGSPVVVEGNSLRVASRESAGGSEPVRVLRTSGPAGT